MVLVEYWGFGVRHIQLLLLVICGTVGAILIKTMEGALVMVETDTNQSNFTLFDDAFRQKVKSWTFEQIYILKNASTIARFVAALLAGLYSTKWNLKYFLLLDFAVLSLQSYLIPIIAKKMAYDYLLAVVILQGFCYGMIPPVTTAILARWTPFMEVGRTCTLVLSCRFIGYFFVYVLALFLRTSLAGWHTLFYIVGNLGLLWCVAWFTFGFQDPKGCFYLSTKEKAFIFSNIRYLTSEHPKGHRVPWSAIITCLPLYGMLATQATFHWLYDMTTDTSLTLDFLFFRNGNDIKYVMDVQYIVPTGIPLIQFGAAFIVDTLVGKKVFPVEHIRKTCNSIGCWGGAMCLLWLCYSPGGVLEICCYVLFQFISVFTNLGSSLAFYDFTRDYSGLIHGLNEFISFIPFSFFIPIMAPVFPNSGITPEQARHHYKTLWYASACPMIIGNFVYIVINSRHKKIESDGKKPTRQSVASAYYED